MKKSSKKYSRIAIFGAAPDTPNMGVSALYISAITAISGLFDSIEFVVFDNNLGLREDYINLNGKNIKIIYFGARGGRKYYRQENLLTMLFMSKLGRFGATLNKGVKLIDSCDAVMDISGGDSFSDIYGLKRFNNIIRPKEIAINRYIPLILLPQTYGPYKDRKVNLRACDIVKKASMAWARDKHSYKILKDMLGADFDKERHHCGVDMAFNLQAKDASLLIDNTLNQKILSNDGAAPIVGINVSGLIYNDPLAAEKTYRLKANYTEIIHGFVKYIIEETNAIIVLISHVMDKPGHYESDMQASIDVAKKVNNKNRVFVSPLNLNQSETKWLISKMDWFCGTRMHSTIAALSSLVPTCAIAYSDKTWGVFASCKQEKYVFDPRDEKTSEIIKKMIDAYSERALIKEKLKSECQKVILKGSSQMVEIKSYISLLSVNKNLGNVT